LVKGKKFENEILNPPVGGQVPPGGGQVYFIFYPLSLNFSVKLD
jgi:hypothetical protein